MNISNLYFIGPMGAGKSSVSRYVAKLLKWPLIDMDDAIEQRAGVSISWIFDQETEAGFRQRETALLEELTQQKGRVLSTGGGIITIPYNCQLLRENGYVIYLRTQLETQLERVQRIRNKRPLLINTPNTEARLALLKTERDPLYESTAHKTYDTDHLDIPAVSQKIVADLKQVEHVV